MDASSENKEHFWHIKIENCCTYTEYTYSKLNSVKDNTFSLEIA